MKHQKGIVPDLEAHSRKALVSSFPGAYIRRRLDPNHLLRFYASVAELGSCIIALEPLLAVPDYWCSNMKAHSSHETGCRRG